MGLRQNLDVCAVFLDAMTVPFLQEEVCSTVPEKTLHHVVEHLYILFRSTTALKKEKIEVNVSLVCWRKLLRISQQYAWD